MEITEMKNQNTNAIDIYYYPTTAVFVDDHQAFLDSLPLVLNADLAYQSFVDPQVAIDFVNSRSQCNPLISEKYIYIDECDDYSFIHFKMDVDAIQSKAGDKQRFFEPSVVIVDYAMPGFDGLEFCKSISNPHIKKILLTGVADENVAVAALNDNVIDYYIKKNSPDVFERINHLIAGYQKQYFTSVSTVIREGLKVNCHFMDDPTLADYFFNAIERRSIAEYYFHNDFSFASLGFMMLTDKGEFHRLIIFTDEDLNAQIDVARDAGAPEALIDTLHSRILTPLFPTFDGFYHPDIGEQWRDYFYPAEKLEGHHNYYFAFIKEADVNHLSRLSSEIYSFNEHLQHHVGSASTLT